MSSASTKRRHKRKTALPRYLPALASEMMREMMKPPGQKDYDAAFRRSRSTGPKDAEPYSDTPLPWNHRAEIQRLRAAMVHAMDDAGRLVLLAAEGASPGALARKANAIAAGLKAALEKK